MITDVRSDSPFWLMKSGFLEVYPSLSENIKVDFVIMGGGISGALQAWHLAKTGASVAVIDRRHIGMSSTAASTALLQYDIDTPLFELSAMIGERKAVRAYQMSLDAVLHLGKIAEQLKIENEFELRPSFRFAASKNDVESIESEVAAREKHGFDIEFWNAARLKKHFAFNPPAAFRTKPSATVDPYRLTHGLLQAAMREGVRVHSKTGAEKIDHDRDGVTIETSQGCRIRAKKLVIACGYESVNHIPFKVVSLNSTYALVSEPLPNNELWYENAIFWDTGDPYIYGRATADNRIIFGGGDEQFYDPARRDEHCGRKASELAARFREMFPDVPLKIDYSWAGTFAETDDGLPYIGAIRQIPNTYFALGYGGNGITFSQIAAEILRDLLTGKPNRDAEIYAFDRLKD